MHHFAHKMLLGTLVIASWSACGDTVGGDGPVDTRRCKPPEGIDASPNSLMDMIELMDSLPAPVTVACVVESLERPLNIISSSSTFSAQPAALESPRIFAMYDDFIMSWVASGDGSMVLEFAEERPFARSVKAEIHVPIQDKITYADFEHIEDDNGTGTICGGCHLYEEPADEVTFGPFWQSEALRPATAETIRVADVRYLQGTCDREVDARRCDIFDAMFNHGEVLDDDFPRILPTIYD